MSAIESTTRSTAIRPGRKLGVCLGLLLLLILGVGASLALGARPVPLASVLGTLADYDAANPEHAVVHSRIARTVGALVTGAALGLAGAGMQGLTRNPLADPGILGLNAGAALAVVASIALFGSLGLGGMMLAAFAGAAAVMTLVYLVASIGREGATPIKLALAGAALAVGLTAVTNALLMISRAALDEFRFWQIGTLAARGVDTYLTALPVVLLGCLIVLGTARVSNAVAMGEQTATALGFNLGRMRLLGSIGIVLLAGTATAVAGPIAFVGLIIPHAVRLLIGSDYRWLMPGCLLAGPVLMLAADVLGRLIAPPGEVQAGVMCALVGAPLFIALMRRGMKAVSL
ncbi:Iron ABC transporter permease [Glutamicibacter creatinolyticus]|uniref:Iron ABC transporter permease n=2 Tax=Glutamicibacter creatinolyticus TaxID=162496 RepID=A0A5B7WVV6_9MICC|nr:iron chelate uptake ABC transporter family permease subunit [Glutamicibacter creatinolyticus]QCY48059.1 Iron ABC transporter permease [Glutamicibacter creatinolyticus]